MDIINILEECLREAKVPEGAQDSGAGLSSCTTSTYVKCFRGGRQRAVSARVLCIFPTVSWLTELRNTLPDLFCSQRIPN